MDDSALAKVQSPSLKKPKTKHENSSSNILKEHMEKVKLDFLVKMQYLEPDHQDKKVYNSVQRIQGLMYLETNHIDKDELIRQSNIKKNERQCNLDLQQKTMEEIYKESFLPSPTAGDLEPKGVNMIVQVNSDGKNDPVSYTTRIYETIPNFNYLPRGREIFQRLIIKAAQCNSVDDLALKKCPV